MRRATRRGSGRSGCRGVRDDRRTRKGSASLPRVTLVDRMHTSRARATAVVVVVAAGVLGAVVAASARPNRYGHSDREERHMFPAVSSGPLDPAWSPDGRWIAFSMRGDIWKVPVDGGEAIALTSGPSYHFEPAWSPDGQRIALSMDVGGNLEVGIVDANGGGHVQTIATHPRGDLQPTWSRDGNSIYF